MHWICWFTAKAEGHLCFHAVQNSLTANTTSAAVFPCKRPMGPSRSPRTGVGLEGLARFSQASACSVLVIVLGQAPISTLLVAFMLFIFSAFAVRKNGAI